MRTRFQGLANVVAFNWPYFALAAVIAAACFAALPLVPPVPGRILFVLGCLVPLPVLASLFTSHWIYDRSGLYSLPWLARLDAASIRQVLVLHAGFDEISETLRRMFPAAAIEVVDIQGWIEVQEPSLVRARVASGGAAEPSRAPRTTIDCGEASVNLAIAFLAAHEVRDSERRVALFGQVRNTLRPGAEFLVVEHLRDVANFLAYSIGFRHFLSASTWARTFRAARLSVAREERHTPFLRVFTLAKDEIAP